MCFGGGAVHGRAAAHCMFLLLISDNNDLTRAPRSTDHSPEYKEYFCYKLDSRVKMRLQNGTKNNNTS